MSLSLSELDKKRKEALRKKNAATVDQHVASTPRANGTPTPLDRPPQIPMYGTDQTSNIIRTDSSNMISQSQAPQFPINQMKGQQYHQNLIDKSNQQTELPMHRSLNEGWNPNAPQSSPQIDLSARRKVNVQRKKLSLHTVDMSGKFALEFSLTFLGVLFVMALHHFFTDPIYFATVL